MGFFGYGSSPQDNWKNFMYGRSVWFYIILAVLAGALFYGMTQMKGKTTIYPTSPRESAWIACTTYLEKEAGLPGPTAEEYTPGKVTLLSDNSYMAVVHYAQKSRAYECTVENTSDGKWLVTDVQVK